MKNIRPVFFVLVLAILVATMTLPFATAASAQIIHVDLSAKAGLPDGYTLEENFATNQGSNVEQFDLKSLEQWRFKGKSESFWLFDKENHDQPSFNGCVSGEEIYEYLDTHPEELESFLSLEQGNAILARLKLEPDGGIKLFKKLYGRGGLPGSWDNNTAIYFWRSVTLDHASSQHMVPYLKIKKEKGKEELVIGWSPVNYDYYFYNRNPALRFKKESR